VTPSAAGIGPRTFTGLKEKVKSVRWLDNREPLAFRQSLSRGRLTITATGHPYGQDLVMRVAECQLAQ
jgi:alpha-L-fucosidase